jgi:hypothetical protein
MIINISLFSSNAHGQINECFNNCNTVTKKSGVVDMVMIKIGLTILTVEPQFSELVKNRGHWAPPP